MASGTKTSNTVEIYSYIARDQKSGVVKGEIKALEESKKNLNKDKSEDKKTGAEKDTNPEKKIAELEDKLTRSFAELENHQSVCR